MNLDFSQLKQLNIDGIKLEQLFINDTRVWKGYKNWVRYSTEADGVTIYNGGLGYKNGYRVRSGGGYQERNTCAHTGFIPVKAGDVVRISGMHFANGYGHGSALNVADSSFTNIGQFSMSSGIYGIFTKAEYAGYIKSSVVEEKPGVWKWIVPPAASGVAYIRITANMYGAEPHNDPVVNADGSLLIVTINEEI